MSYLPISVRETLEKINAPNNGWYLPQVQRQYVWGARHQSETYICLLLDSLLRRYPIGGIVLWETDREVPYRKFIEDYVPGSYAKEVDSGLWGAHKSLVYDGQQRLQTLYSVLRHRFNGRVLHFDLLFDKSVAEADETGFLFRDADASPDPRYLRMTELSAKQATSLSDKPMLRARAKPAANGDQLAEARIEGNLDVLWEIFVGIGHKAISYFSVSSDGPGEVNEVFRRLNTGGVALTQLELVLSKMKATHSDYEERLWKLSDEIKKESGGIEFSSAQIMQFLYLVVKDTLRIDETRFDASDVARLEAALSKQIREPLLEMFRDYLYQFFKINDASIVPRWLAVLPIAVYLTARKGAGIQWRFRDMPAQDQRLIHQYFLLSQFCDWNTQTMVNAFSRLAVAAANNKQPFPLAEIRELAIQKNRPGDLVENQLLDQPWLATKVIMKDRAYNFGGKKPQVDHIFPLNLNGADDEYRKTVDCLWNFQPMPANVNNYKRNNHPRDFFLSDAGRKYWSDYDFIPKPEVQLWDDATAFVNARRELMLEKLKDLYGLNVSAA